MEFIDNLLGTFRNKIHQHVAAKNDVHRIGIIQQRRKVVLRQVEIAKSNHPFDIGENLKTAVGFFCEVSFFESRRGAAKRPFSVDTVGSFREKVRIYIRRQYSDLPILEVRNHSLEQNGDRVSLLTGRATSAPDS